jgi:YidC/Oxa1 family membrane protein insertase
VNNENQSFLDTRTLLAVLLVGTTFVGWQMYMQRKYPEVISHKTEVTTATNAANTSAKTPNQDSVAANVGTPETPLQGTVSTEKVLHYESANLAFDLSSRGMGIKTFRILNYKDRKGDIVELGHPEEKLLSMETGLIGRPESLDFQMEQLNPNLFVGRAQLGDVHVTKTMEVIPEKYLLNFKLEVKGSDPRFIGITTALTEDVEAKPSGEHFLPQYQKQEFYVDYGDTKERVVFAKDDVQKSWSRVRLASVGSQYFTQVVLDKSSIMPDGRAQLNHAGRAADILLQYPVLNKGADLELAYSAFVGPKSLSLLREVDENLAHVVDFGFFNWIGRHILELLKAFYGLVGNWGIAVICLTVVVRLLVLPVNIYSYKSMKAMQAIQPQIKALREHYKDDQAKQQQEMMALMKAHKVNPVGGCLPVLLQFPIFIALYQVLGNSIELYQAPFGLWIHDLSLKDPFYILPVLMGLTMFVQQKITPNTMDPAQAKVLLMMPLMFTFFMVSLPSGLTLYMLVGAVFSVAQQTYFMKQSPANAGELIMGKK